MSSSLKEISTNPKLTFDPETARAIAQQCNSAADSYRAIRGFCQRLVDSGSAGNFQSALSIQRGLGELGSMCVTAIEGLLSNAKQLGDAVRAAGQRIETTDAMVAAALRSTSDKAGGYPAVGQPSTGAVNCQPTDPDGKDAFLGRFPCDTKYETSPGGGVIDWGFTNSQPADVGKLQALVEAWMSVARDIAATAEAMEAGIGGILSSGSWTGTAADGIRAGSQNVVNIASSTGKNAFSNANVVAGWAAAVIGTRSGFETLKGQLEQQKFAYNTAIASSGFSPALVAQQRAALQALDQQGRVLMNSTYNPGSVHTSTSLLNLPDPGSPIGTILPLGFAPPGGSAGTAPSSAASSGGSVGGGGSGPGSGGGGGGGGSTAAARNGTDAAGQLARQGTGDPVSNAAKSASSQSGQNPAAAAQQAVSKAGDGAKGLGGSRSGAGSMTRPAGLGSLSEAERNAAKAAAGGMKGAGGGGGGAGKLGGAGGLGGAAAAESALSRNSSSLSAAEKALAGQQGATASRAATPASGGPMGARGAGAKGEEDKEHRAAKYLKHVENGEEIAGDLPDTAPPVLGGLNLDTTDDTTAEQAIPRRDS